MRKVLHNATKLELIGFDLTILSPFAWLVPVLCVCDVLFVLILHDVLGTAATMQL